tara:strand:+ start:895 stop:1704 length:810 start_codon:yes stop_codon:yes gene_type:complete
MNELDAEVVTEAPAPVEAPVAAIPEDTATSDTEASVESEGEPQAEEKPKARRNRRTHNQRISQLTAKNHQLERELERFQAEKDKPAPPDAPKRESFDDYEEFIEARAVHSATQAATAHLETVEKTRAESETSARQAQYEAQRTDAREELLYRGAAQYEDFDAVANKEDLKISQVMADVILSRDKGHEIWYHLGKNPEAAAQIESLDPPEQVIQLRLLEAKLAEGKTASGAPRPTKPVNSRGSSNNQLSDNMSTKDWMQKRSEQIRKRSI